MKLFWSRWAKRSEHGRRSRRLVRHGASEMASGMYADGVDGGGRGPLWRLGGVAISVMLVSEYIILGATTLALRALLGVAAGAWRRLLPPRDRPRDAAMPGAEAA